LWLCGRPRENFPAVSPEPGLRVLGESPDRDLSSLYSNTVSFAYPSWYEGFGLPVLEAMQCGASVLISRDPALTEVAGEAAVQLDAGDVCAWSAALESCARGGDWMEERRARSLARAREFSWARTARLTREVYAEACRRFGR